MPNNEHIPIFTSSTLDDWFKRPDPTVPCDKCGKLFRAESESMVWEDVHPEYKNYCRECYEKAINENPTEEDIKNWAEESIRRSEYEPNYVTPFDCHYKNFQEKVLPKIKEIVEGKKIQKKREHRQQIIDEATKIYQEAWGTEDKDGYAYHYEFPMMGDIRIVNVIANLLERIEKLEKKIPPRDIMHDRFNV